jgi:hypothetical protein
MMLARSLTCIAILASTLCNASDYPIIPQQTPDVATNQEVWDAVDTVWKIRAKNKWGDTLGKKEAAAVAIALDANDSMVLKAGLGFYVPQFLEILFGSGLPTSTRIQVRADDTVFAGYNGTEGRIVITLGLLSAYYWTQWAVEEARENPQLQPRLGEYLFALSRNNFQRSPVSASSLIRLTEYVTGTPWHPDYKTTISMESRVTAAVRDALIFTIAHEGCHAILGHRPLEAGPESFRQEWQADTCSVSRVNTGPFTQKFNPYLALAVFALSGLDDQRNPRLLTTHPNSLCRMAWMISNGNNNAASIGSSVGLFPLLVDVYRFKPLAQDILAKLPRPEDRHPNNLAINRIIGACGGWGVPWGIQEDAKSNRK